MITGAALHEWEGRPVDEWRERWMLPGIVALREVGSTSDIARSLAEEGADAGFLVMAEHQTAGRGRMQRPWTDEPGRSLLLSFVLRPTRGSDDAAPGTIPIRVGIAIAGALRAAAGIDARLKWPNDVVVDGAGKLAGILCEAVSVGGETVIIAGIGINVLQQPDDWPAALRGHATSVAQVRAGTAVGRAVIMDAVVAALRPLFTRSLEPFSDEELRAYAALDALSGHDVCASGPQPVRGRASGIAADGALIVDDAGDVRRITSGTVRVIAPHPHSTARTQR